MEENTSFKSEGIELRVKQRVITETVIQSTSRDLSIRLTPRIFLGEDGLLYFQDNVIQTPTSLDKMKNLYERIQYVDGELRFLTKSLESYVTLSQMTETDSLLVNTNSVLYSNRKLWSPDEKFSALNVVVDAHNSLTPSIDVGTTLTDAITGKEIFWEVFVGERLRFAPEDAEEDTIFDTMVKQFTVGLKGFREDLNAEFCDDEYCTIQNKHSYLNDSKIGLSRLPTDLQGKIYLFGENLLTLDNYAFTNMYDFNGVGKFIRKVFGENKPSLTETYDDFFYEEDGYTTILRTGVQETSGSFILNGTTHVQCGPDNIPTGSSGAYSIGEIKKGYIGLRVLDNTMTFSPAASAGQVNAYLGCSDDNTIGKVDSSLGIIKFDGDNFSSFIVEDDIDDYKVWFDDHTATDNSGSAKVQVIYSPLYVDYDGTFEIDGVKNAVFYDNKNLNRGNQFTDPVHFLENTDTTIVGIFPAGMITLTLEGGAIRYTGDTAVFYNQPDGASVPLSGAGDLNNLLIGNTVTNLGILSFEFGKDLTFEITDEMAPFVLEAWYQENDNINNEGSVTYKYSFEEKVPLKIPPVIPGQGIYYDNILFKYQDVAIEEISRSFSYAIYQRYMIEMHQYLLLNNIVVEEISGSGNNIYEFLEEDMYVGLLSTETILNETQSRLENNKSVLLSELRQAFEDVFSPNVQSKINLSDYSQYVVGGQFVNNRLYNIDFSLFNGVWFDLEEFYTTSPKISNDSGISVLASLNVDVHQTKKMRYEFRIFETVSQTELDNVMIESRDFHADDEVGNIFKDGVETFPIQLNYIGPVPPVLCSEEAFKKCQASTNLDVNSHIKLNASDLYSEDAVHSGFKVITDRIKSLDIAAKTGNVETSVIELSTPRIFRVQWRMIMNEDDALTPHKADVSDISFNANSPRNDDFEISLNVYNLGDASRTKILTQGVEEFADLSKKRVTVSSLATLVGNDYSISLSCSKNIKVWFEDKSGNGFTIVAEKRFTGEVSWIVNKQATPTTEDESDKESDNTLPDCVVDYKPPYGKLTNFDIFKREGYQIDIEMEDGELTISEAISASNAEETNDGYFVDANGILCSSDCQNDCPDDWYCSSDCPNAPSTESGCACCECITDINCPTGYICSGFGECIPGF